MCLNPIIIKNNRKDFYRSLHLTALSVPCCKCDDCVNLRRSDYAIRTAFECKRFNVDNGGTAIMVLFTYNNEHVPYLPGTDQMAFNRQHIKLLNDMLRLYYFSTISNPKFAYLIGAEYGVDERFTQRPHYHGLYILSSSIDPRDFMNTIRMIWQGEITSIYSAQHRHTYQWIYGNLGLILPFEDDPEHDYIVRDAASASIYCAKYAVKQVGFYNKPAVNYFIERNLKHSILQYLPKVWTSRGFGKSMVNDSTFDMETQQVVNPYTLRSVTIPRAIQEMVLYDRIWKGRKSHVFDPETHEMVFKRNGHPLMRKLYEREYKSTALPIRLNQLDRMIDNYTDKLCSVGCNSFIARNFAIFHYVFDRLPLPVVYHKFPFGLDGMSQYYQHYKEIYEFSKFNRFSLSSAISDGYKPRYKVSFNPNALSLDYLLSSGTTTYVPTEICQDDAPLTFNDLLTDEQHSLYIYYTSLLKNLSDTQALERERKYKETQELRLLINGEHPQ